MNRTLPFLVLLLSFHAYGNCVARAYLEEEAPLYRLELCVAASEVIDAQLIDRPYSHPSESDKAVLVIPLNESANSMMWSNSEHWHYSGSCSDLPLQKVVSLQLESHCSDLGTTLYLLLGDITIKSANEQQL